MIGNPRMFTSLHENVDEQDKITFGDNSKGKVHGLGKVAISNDLSISNVLLVAPLSFNLLSVGQLIGAGCPIFRPMKVTINLVEMSHRRSGFQSTRLEPRNRAPLLL
jgi:hypothetical protein